MPNDDRPPAGGSHTEPTEMAAVPISVERLDSCLASARAWVAILPGYADRQQTLADRFGIISGVVASITGLAIWPVVSSDDTLGKWFASGLALTAAVTALIPRVKNWAETAGQARELAGRYGSVLGQLEDLCIAVSSTSGHAKDAIVGPPYAEAARSVVREFEATKAKKDGLRGLPERDVELARMDARVAEARAHPHGRWRWPWSRTVASPAPRSDDRQSVDRTEVAEGAS